MAIQYLPVSWSDYHQFAQNLAAALLTHDTSVTEIVAISRGGLTFGHILTDFLQVPIWTIAIQSYTDIQTQGEIKINGKLQTSIEGKHILLVDDVADSGKTLERAVEYIQEGNPAKVTTMTMFYKPHSVFLPDYFAKKTNKWILFPYEVSEMISLISKSMMKQKKTKADIQLFLNKLGYTNKQIAFTRKYHMSKSSTT